MKASNAFKQYTQIGGLLGSSDANENLSSDLNGNTYTYDPQYIAVETAWTEFATARSGTLCSLQFQTVSLKTKS
jgi:hypothetical protein